MENSIIQALLVSSEKQTLSEFVETLQGNNVEITLAESGESAVFAQSNALYNIVVIDEFLEDMVGLSLAEKLITMNPMTNCVVISSLSAEDFHEASEGLGILMQLPIKPEKIHAEKLLEHLKKILVLTVK